MDDERVLNSVMPGGPAHLLYGASFGLLLSKATDGSFTPPCVLIFAIANFLGPDLGTWLGWFEENVRFAITIELACSCRSNINKAALVEV